MNHAVILVVTILSFQAMVKVSEDTSLVLDADKDNVIYKESGKKSNGSGDYLFAGLNGGGSVRRSLIHFDLSKIPKNAVVSKVSVDLKVTRANKAGSTVSLHRLKAAWGEGKSDAAGGEGGGAQALTGDTTWENAVYPNQNWETAGGHFKSEASAKIKLGRSGNAVWTSERLAQDVRDWIRNDSTNFGWILIGDESLPGTAVRFGSRNNEKDKPRLRIEYSLEK
ncbi:MAG: DNRLRE domain-containing protein [Planctomycetota bacterium]